MAEDDCISSGACEEICTEVFTVNGPWVAQVVNPSGTPADQVQEAVEACRCECIIGPTEPE